MRYSELEKELKKAGCKVYREGANHSIWYSPVTGQKFPVSRHKTEEIPAGTLKSIRRAATSRPARSDAKIRRGPEKSTLGRNDNEIF